MVEENQWHDPAAIQEELQMRLRADLHPLFKVHSVHITAALPRTASPKVMRRLLRQAF